MTEPLNNNNVLGTASGFSYCSNPINCCCFLLQEIVPTQGSKLCLLSFLHWKIDCLPLVHGRGFLSSSTSKESACNAGDPWFNFWVGKIPWRRDRLPTPVFLGFPGGSDGKDSTCNVGDLGLIPGLGRPLGEGHGNPLQYSCLENPHGERNLESSSPWGHKESNMTEQLSTA